MTNYRGIDYGLGRTNVDQETGIRYGVIPIGCLCHENDDLEAVYWCGCPKCGSEIDPDDLDCEYTCSHCGETLDDYECWGEEPIGYRYNQDGLTIEGHSDGDLFITRSPVVIRAQFCSPCAPGACYLKNPVLDGEYTYALPYDWFDEYCPCPYTGLLLDATTKTPIQS